MDLTPDGPLGERDKDMNTLPTEAVGTTHHGSTGSDQAGKRAEGLQETKEAFGAQFAEWDVEDRKAKSGTSTDNLADQQTKPLDTKWWTPFGGQQQPPYLGAPFPATMSSLFLSQVSVSEDRIC